MSNSDLPTLLVSGQDDERPLPLIIAQKWEFPLTYVENDEGFFYAVQDWIKGLSGRESTHPMWAMMRRANKTFKISGILKLCRKLPYRASNGEIPHFQAIDIKQHESVYIIRCEWPEYGDIYKIGRSRNPGERLSKFDHQFPFPITLIVCSKVSNASRVESQLHQHFSKQRVRNEWFRLSPQDLDYAKVFIGQQV